MEEATPLCKDTRSALRTPPSLMPHISKEEMPAEGSGHGTSPGDVQKGPVSRQRNPRCNPREMPFRAKPEPPKGEKVGNITDGGGVCRVAGGPPWGLKGMHVCCHQPSLHVPHQVRGGEAFASGTKRLRSPD